MGIRTFFVLFLLVAVSCSQSVSNSTAPTAPLIDGNAIKAHIQKLASDEMEGRAPGGKGEDLATSYIADFYKLIGLKTQSQPVPLVGITSTVSPLETDGQRWQENIEVRGRLRCVVEARAGGHRRK